VTGSWFHGFGDSVSNYRPYDFSMVIAEQKQDKRTGRRNSPLIS
jgi:hypothetical protein